MRFGIYLPPQSENEKVPVLVWLSGEKVYCPMYEHVYIVEQLFCHKD